MSDLNFNESALATQIVGNDELYKLFIDSQGRASVNANVTFPEALYTSPLFLNGTNDNMNVNGAGTNQNFSATIGSTVKYVESVALILEDNADFGITGFGALGALTNGLLLTVRSKGINRDIAFFRQNYSTYTFFKEHGAFSLTTGLLTATRTFLGSYRFQQRIALDPAQGDFIRFVVRDNLTGLVRLTARCTMWELNG